MKRTEVLNLAASTLCTLSMHVGAPQKMALRDLSVFCPISTFVCSRAFATAEASRFEGKRNRDTSVRDTSPNVRASVTSELVVGRRLELLKLKFKISV